MSRQEATGYRRNIATAEHKSRRNYLPAYYAHPNSNQSVQNSQNETYLSKPRPSKAMQVSANDLQANVKPRLGPHHDKQMGYVVPAQSQFTLSSVRSQASFRSNKRVELRGINELESQYNYSIEMGPDPSVSRVTQ